MLTNLSIQTDYTNLLYYPGIASAHDASYINLQNLCTKVWNSSVHHAMMQYTMNCATQLHDLPEVMAGGLIAKNNTKAK